MKLPPTANYSRIRVMTFDHSAFKEDAFAGPQACVLSYDFPAGIKIFTS